MNLDDFIKKMKIYLDTADAVYLIGQRKTIFLKILNMVRNDAESVENERKDWMPTTQEESNQKINEVISTLKHLQAILNEQAISNEGSNFIDSYSTLIYNWNENTYKNPDINQFSQTINRFINLRLTSIELLQELKKASKIIRDVSNVSFQPIQLSRHFLESFDKNNK